ncbi:unnamed protein product [Rotaria sordida]|uniref:Uncharacterized protein n=1 Tax=Rotaria sordida TaxID=392033 RepID=A0A813NBT9_9BILA|nr:unnamed protein product [Rotaria sordida]CAF3641198.1 unnamed protein product [Rotaria sordida]
MLRVLVSGIWTTANTLLNRNQNSSNEQSSTSTWHKFRNFIFSAISSFGIPLVRSITQNETLYEYVNTCLAYSTTNRNNVDHRQQRNPGVNRLSRPNFRRRSYHNGGVIRIIKPTINIHIHQT